MIAPPGPKKTPRQAVPAADQGKVKSLEATLKPSASDKPKFRRDGKWLSVEWRPGITVRIDTEGRDNLPDWLL